MTISDTILSPAAPSIIEAATPPMLAFSGEGADRITVTAEAFVEGSTSHAPLHIAEVIGADIAAFGGQDGTFAIDSRDNRKRDTSGDYCLLARLNIRDAVLIASSEGVETYTAVLTGARAYSSYKHDPILEGRSGYAYLPPVHQKIAALTPIQVTVTVTPVSAR
jgi:hypothetical protein